MVISGMNKIPEKTTKTKKKSNGMEALTAAGFKLFDKLSELRLHIAREEHMPPYIIFSDKTLIDMAVKVPESKYEMLNVSGVGERKFAKYGERFLVLIEACIGENPELIQNRVEISQHIEFDVKMESTAKPDDRTAEYYKKRPCLRVVEDAAEIVEEMINNSESAIL